jgi:hypothetical protein
VQKVAGEGTGGSHARNNAAGRPALTGDGNAGIPST